MDSLPFLYVLLPLCLAVYALVPVKWRPSALLGLSILYYFVVAPKYLPLMVACVAADFILLQVVGRFQGIRLIRGACIGLSLAKGLAAVLLTGAAFPGYRELPVPGVLIYNLAGLDCLVTACQGGRSAGTNPLGYSLYCCFFARLDQGPLLEYTSFEEQLSGLRFTLTGVVDAAGVFLIGVMKLLLPARYLGAIYDSLRLYEPGEVSVLSAWMMVLTLALSVYYRLSGYADMARGVAGLFGLRLPKNFYYPYQSRGILDFYQRFNTTVGNFLRRTVYRGLGDGKKGRAADCFAMLLMGMLLGMWFGTGTGYLAWGAFLAAFAMMERYLYPGVLARVPTLFLRLYSLAVVLVSFSWYAGGNAAQGAVYLVNLFRFFSLPLLNNRIMYLLSSNWLLILLTGLFASNLFSIVTSLMRKASRRAEMVLHLGADFVLLAVVTALLIQ